MKKVAALQLLTNTLPDDLLKKIRYLEASTAMLYWPLLGKKLPEPFGFTERVKKDPKDPFNMSINYLYGMLKNKVETGILGMGLDPSVGCIHREGYSLPPLVFDLMEPFRPVMDRLLVELILSGKLKNIVETKDDGYCRLNSTGRKCLIACFNEKIGKVLIFRKARTTLGNHILLEIKSFADEIKKI